MTIKLPTVKVPATQKSPTRLFIFSQPKVGKTSACSMLEDSLILDFEGGTSFLDAVKLRVIGLTIPSESSDDREQRHANNTFYLQEVVAAIKENKYPYKYLIIDTVTKLEDLALDYAKTLYKSTPIGKEFKGESVLHLPKGAGYQWLREAMSRVCANLESLAPRIIYVGHLKTSSLDKDGKEISVSDVDLTGKIKSAMTANADAIGLLKRNGNKTYLSFRTGDDILAGARPEHLRNKDVLLTEMVDGQLIAHWDSIYID